MLRPLRFIQEPIEVSFNKLPTLEKKPGPPNAFHWRGQQYWITEVVSEWHDYRRRGRMARNMSTEHSQAAERGGSWGVGQDTYRVRTEEGRFFDLYYDRAPKDVDQRKGAWFLDRELSDQP